MSGKVNMAVALDTDALNADSLKAALICLIESFDQDCERKIVAPDWSKIELAIFHGSSDPRSSSVVLRSPTL